MFSACSFVAEVAFVALSGPWPDVSFLSHPLPEAVPWPGLWVHGEVRGVDHLPGLLWHRPHVDIHRVAVTSWRGRGPCPGRWTHTCPSV